jgi:hypothetical protein
MTRRARTSWKKAVLPPEAKDDFSRLLEHDPRFLRRIEQAHSSLRAGHGVRLEDLEQE